MGGVMATRERGHWELVSNRERTVTGAAPGERQCQENLRQDS